MNFILSRLLSYAWPLAAALGVSMLGVIGVQAYTIRGLKLEAAQSLAKAVQDARDREQRDNAENAKVTDELLKDRALAVAAAASSADRLRKLSATASKEASACRRLDEPTASIVRDDFREAVEREAQRADQVAIQLTKLQDYVRRVCLQ